jgi:hypothetical protein
MLHSGGKRYEMRICDQFGVGHCDGLVVVSNAGSWGSTGAAPRPEDVASGEEEDGADDSLLGAYIELQSSAGG